MKDKVSLLGILCVIALQILLPVVAMERQPLLQVQAGEPSKAELKANIKHKDKNNLLLKLPQELLAEVLEFWTKQTTPTL